MSIIKVNAIQHTSANGSNMTLFANGNAAMTLANSTLTVGNTVISNAGISVGGASFSPYGTMKNRIINGDMRIDQRFSGNANNNIAGAQYNVDRWLHNGSSGSTAAKLRFQQNNTNGPGTSATQAATGFTNYFGANTVTANTTINAGDYWIVAQIVEGFNIGDFNWGTANASPVTLSFWVYSSVAGTHAGSLRNGNSDRSYPFTYTISTANTWQYQTVTVPGDTTGTWYTNSSGGTMLTFSLGTGSTFSSSTAGSWQAGNYFNVTNAVNVVSNANGAFYLTGVQLEKGTQATSWDWRHYGTELSLCQRYYYQFKGGGASPDMICMGYMLSSTQWEGLLEFPVEMRADYPTITFTATNTFAHRINGTIPTGINTYAYNGQLSRKRYLIYTTTSGQTTGQATMLVSSGTNVAAVYVSAELGVAN